MPKMAVRRDKREIAGDAGRRASSPSHFNSRSSRLNKLIDTILSALIFLLRFVPIRLILIVLCSARWQRRSWRVLWARFKFTKFMCGKFRFCFFFFFRPYRARSFTCESRKNTINISCLGFYLNTDKGRARRVLFGCNQLRIMEGRRDEESEQLPMKLEMFQMQFLL